MVSPVENEETLSELRFDNGLYHSQATTENAELKELVMDLGQSMNEDDQKKSIQRLVDMYKSSVEREAEDVQAKNVILDFLAKYSLKKMMKKFLQAVIGPDVAIAIVKSTRDEIVERINKQGCCNIKQCYDLVNLAYLMQTTANFQYDVTIEYLFPLYFVLFEAFVKKTKLEVANSFSDDFITLMHAVLKQILFAMAKIVPYTETIASVYCTKLIVLCHTVIADEKLSFDLKTKCCLIILYSSTIFPDVYRNNFKLKSCPFLEFLDKYNDKGYIVIADQKLPVFKHIESVVAIYATMLGVVPQQRLVEVKVNDQPLVVLLFSGLLECARGQISANNVIVEISRAISTIGKHLKIIPADRSKQLFLESIFYAWGHIDHFIDSVRNYSRQFFADLAMWAAHEKNSGKLELAAILLQYVKDLGPTQTAKFLGIENIALHLGLDMLLRTFAELQDALLAVVAEPTVSDQACKTYILVMEKHFEEVETEEWVAHWVAPATRLLKNKNPNVSRMYLVPCQRIIIKAFQLQPAILWKIFPDDYVGNTQESCVLLKCLHYARLNGVKATVDAREKCCAYWRSLIEKEKMMKFAVHQDDEIRITALAAVVDTQKSTEIFLDFEFEFLLTYIRFNITSQIPNIRKQMITYYKKAFTRYSAGYYVITKHRENLLKQLAEKQGDRELDRVAKIYNELTDSYKSFILRMAKQLISNLTYDSNYFRRSISLDLLVSLQKLLGEDEWRRCWTEEDVINCHNILFDSYEGNKKLALMVLKHLPPSSMGLSTKEFTSKYIKRSLEMVLDFKPSKPLSAAYLLEACAYSPYYYDALKEEGFADKSVADPKLDLFVTLLGTLTRHATKFDGTLDITTGYHGILLCIRHILENRDINKNNDAYLSLLDHLVVLCLNLTFVLMPIVCNVAPEGYLPDAEDECSQRETSLRAQKILSFAWLTIREMTLLFAEIVKQTVQLENSFEMVPEELLIDIGKFFIEIFIESKHKGVFEKAFVGFAVICEAFWVSKNSNLNCLPKVWLKEALDICTGEEECDDLSWTRRSAGLPFLILAVLTTEPVANNRATFHETMRKLLAISQIKDKSYEKYKIHSMNVLRMIFRHSRLGEAVAFYVSSGIKLAFTCFKTRSWEVRNAATLLFATLITRIFGVQRTTDSLDVCMKNKLTFRVFFQRYPQLLDFLLGMLAEECTNDNSLVLHPLLMVLSRLYPSHMEENNAQMEQFLPHITKALSNPNFRTRDLAARASVPLIRPDKVRDHLLNCFELLSRPDVNDNQCQGVLLQLRYLLDVNAYFGLPVTQCLKDTVHILARVGEKYSHMTVSLYMEVILVILAKFQTYPDVGMLRHIMLLLSRQMTSSLLPVTSMGKYPQTRMMLVLFIAVNKFEENESTYPTVTNQIMSHLYGRDVEMKRFCLNLLIYMNQALNDSSPKHALYQLEELQVPEEVLTIVNAFDKQSIKKVLTHIHPYLKCFLTEEIKFQHYIKKEDQVLLFLLLNYYPCVIKYLNLSKQETLTMLLKFCDCDNEELISAVVSCIGTFLLQLDYSVLSYSRLVQVLMESASPAASAYRRLAVCQFLSRNYILYCNEEPILNGDELQVVLSVIMVLLEDDELVIRNAMSAFASVLKIRVLLNKNTTEKYSGYRWPVVPEKAREDLLNLIYMTLPKDKAICFLFSWMCRHFPGPASSKKSSEVFERSEVNVYAENVAFMDLCIGLLHKLLWRLEDDLSYEDKSIFIEEHVLLGTTILLDSISRHPSPMMLYKTKLSVICALKSIIKFLERCEIGDGFIDEFRVYLDQTTLNYLTIQVDHSDTHTVKRVFRRIYEPILNYNRNGRVTAH
ncbi:hypothetical protein NQ315_012640 [Exocentrus adspersus]|uniref:tRNA (32-2'-O)-methyltransferase regulator THADA n=1 Tax=Exocentrus adspersus TaxID=1586481 RepID=A0AAV8VRW7_9CUCU|nr:hypothetical protein NQ315_012640 [Exocentrus adspersus]